MDHGATGRPRLGAEVVGGGVRFTVWAPERRKVEVAWKGPEGRSGRQRLERGPEGVWAGVVPGAGAGTRYGYVLDGEGPFPDPYARAMPEGVHRLSEVVDVAAFRWTDAGWPGLRRDGQIFYEIHVGAFTPEGTFGAVIPRLAELKRLGITAIELMPVSSFPGRWNWGYDGVGHYAPAAAYGGPEGLYHLVDAAHRVGLGVILDVVYNHLGPSGNYLRAFSPAYFTGRHHTPWGEAINYDGPRSGFVRDWAIGNAIYWLVEFHLDGLRLDATAEIKDKSPVHLLRELSERARAAVDRSILLIAEDSRREPRLVRPVAEGGDGLDCVWADDFNHTLRTLLLQERDGYYAAYSGHPRELLSTIEHGFLEDGPRRKGKRLEPTAGIAGAAFVYASENHDQVGNRARGERLAHLVSPAIYRAASALLLLVPETPLLFMGQEFAACSPFQYFTDHEPELGRLVTEGRRAEFKKFAAFGDPSRLPDPQDPQTFYRSKLDFADRERHAAVYRLYQDLLALRKSDSVLRRQDRAGLRGVALGEKALAFRLGAGDLKRLVVANFGEALETSLPDGLVGAHSWQIAFSADAPEYGGAGRPAAIDGRRLQVPPATAVLFTTGGGG